MTSESVALVSKMLALRAGTSPDADVLAAARTAFGDLARIAVSLIGPAGVDALAGRADKRFLQALQVLLVEVLGPFDRLACPMLLLFDKGGQLTVVYAGVPDVAAVLADASATRALDPAGGSTEPLLRGRWARSYPRNLEGLAQIFDLLGDPDLGRYYHAASARARARAGK